MTTHVQLDPHDGSTHQCHVELIGPMFPTREEGGWDTCREAEWLALCEDVDAIIASDELRYPSGSSLSVTADRDS